MRRSLPKSALCALAVFFLSSAVAGCRGSNEGSREVREIPCSAIIDSVEILPDEFDAVARNMAAFPVGDQFLGSGARVGASGTAIEGFRFAKYAMLVREDVQLTVTLSASDGATVAPEWAPSGEDPAVPGAVVAVGPCSGDESTAGGRGIWKVFAGGIWLSKPACVVIGVESSTTFASTAVDFGQSCD
jgi:hypothetical protein